MIRWKGTGPTENSSDFSSRLDAIREDLEELDRKQKQLDEHEALVLQSLKSLIEESDSADLAYVTQGDLRNVDCFKDDTLLAVRGPAGTQLIVPESLAHMPPNYSIYLHGKNGPVDALLVTTATADADDSEGVGANMDNSDSGAAVTKSATRMSRKRSHSSRVHTGAATEIHRKHIYNGGAPHTHNVT
eukprot:m.212227 g.212227  ORF g.212227 m.212227 type:complete len:188 (+) comp19037_c0_seq12:193-756(+)